MKAALFDLETVLITRRTVVRRLREQEGDVLFELLRTNADMLMDVFPPMLTGCESTELTEIHVRKKLAAWLLQEAFHFAVWDKESARMIGYVAIDPIYWDLPKARMQGFLDKKLHSSGLMSEVFGILLPFAFQQLGLEKISMEIGTENIAAQRLLRRFGFIREGDLRGEYQKNSGEPVDVLLFGLGKNHFQQ